MESLHAFAINNFLLFCISIVLIVLCVVRFRQHPRISTYTILLLSNTLLIAVMVLLCNLGKEIGNIPLATATSMLGYVLRPICILFIILMTGKIDAKNKRFIIFIIPLILNFVVYSLMLFPATKELVVSYEPTESGSLIFKGWSFLRYVSHIISGLYLIFVLYISFTKISSKHLGHGLTILACALFVVVAVVIESFFNPNGDIELLNDTIAVSALVYYLFLYIERTQIDTLTGLFNRETYYHDVQKMGRSVTGVIHFDMNGLKYINDTYGHFEGDKALAAIADVISKSAKRNMYVYRLGGDEYIVLSYGGSEADIIETVNEFKERIKDTGYHCSYGYSYRQDKNATVEDLIKEAERKMYEDKERFYKNSSFERRKVEEIK